MVASFNNSWYETRTFTVGGRQWTFTYSEMTANRSLISNDGIVFKIPVTDINKYRSPYLWLQSRFQDTSVSSATTPSIFDITPSKLESDHHLEITPSKLENDAEGTLRARSKLEITPSKPDSDRSELEITPSKKQSCSDTLTSSQGLAVLPSQPIDSAGLEQSNLSKSTKTRRKSSPTTGQLSLFTPTSEITTQGGENSTSLPADSPAPEHRSPETERDCYTPNQPCGGRGLDALSSVDLDSWLLNNLRELSIEDLEQFLGLSEWQATVTKLKSSRRESAAAATGESDCLLFPTPTANLGTYRQAGQNRCEKWFRGNGLIPDGSQLGTSALAAIVGYPSNWFAALNPSNSNQPTTPNPPTPPAELEPENLQGEPLPPPKPRSPSKESSIYTVCKPDQINPLCQGCIYKESIADTGYVCLLKKNFFNKPDAVKPCSKFLPQGEFRQLQPTKKRRPKGEGSGTFITSYANQGKYGNKYPQISYQVEFGGKKRSIYLSKDKVDLIKSLHAAHKPIVEILGAIGSPKADLVARDYQEYLASR